MVLVYGSFSKYPKTYFLLRKSALDFSEILFFSVNRFIKDSLYFFSKLLTLYFK